jgi:ribose transport system substrate-binding protein
MRRMHAAAIVPAVGLLLLASACSSSSTSTTPSEAAAPASSEAAAPASSEAAAPAADATQIMLGELPFDITNYCGTKPMVVGILDAYGGNGWAVGKKAILEKLSAQCPNVTDVLYVDSNFDVQQYIAGVDSLVAQGANVIETFDAFGQAPVEAFRKAQAAGVLIGNGNAIPGDAKVPADVTANVIPDMQQEAEIWVEWLTKATNNAGKIAYIGGPAGNLFDVPSLAAVNKAIANQGSGITVVTPEPVAGNWDPAATQQAVTGLLQKDPSINGIISTYTATIPAIMRAYEAAGVPYPAITGQSASMEAVCEVGKAVKKDPKFQVQSLDGSQNLHALSLAKLFAAFQGIAAPELGPTDGDTLISYPSYINTLEGVLPACDSSVPPSADLSGALTKEESAAAFAK